MSYEDLLDELKAKARADVNAEVEELRSQLRRFENRTWETREALLGAGIALVLGVIFGAIVF